MAKTYFVTINFAGYYGCDQTYEVIADSREEAEDLARAEAQWDLSVEEVEEEQDED